jgi:O-antigen ligase
MRDATIKKKFSDSFLNTIGQPTPSFLLIVTALIICASIAIVITGNMLPLIAFLGLIILIVLLYNFDLMFYGFLYTLPILSQFGGNYAILIIRFYSLLIIGLWILRKLIGNERIQFPPSCINVFFISLALLILTSSINNLYRIDLEASLRIFAFCIMFYVYYDWSTNKNWRIIMGAILFPLALSAIFLIIKLTQNPGMAGIMKLTFLRYSTFVNNAPNVLGAYFCMSIPPAFALAILSNNRALKRYSLIVLPFSLLALFISNSRAAYLGVVFGLLVLAFSLKKTRVVSIWITAICIFIFMAIPNLRQMGSFILRLNVDPTSRRTVVWQSSLDNIKQRPFWGSGVGNEAKDISDDLTLAAYKHEFGDEVGAHDLFLNKAVEFGLMGIALILFLNYIFAKIIISNFKSKLSPDKLILNYIAMSVAIALLLRSFFEHSVWISGTGMFPELYSWIIMAWPIKIYHHNQLNKNKHIN